MPAAAGAAAAAAVEATRVPMPAPACTLSAARLADDQLGARDRHRAG